MGNFVFRDLKILILQNKGVFKKMGKFKGSNLM